jgi:DNA-directed RNA polymerase specialized sigma24 family protein
VAKANKAEAQTKKIESMDRIANLLALLLIKDSKPREAILQLWRAGFPDEEIAKMLNTTLGNIRQTRYIVTKKKIRE